MMGPPCQGCGGPHPFDTSIPHAQWRQLFPEDGYYCLTCIVAAATRAGVSFGARLWGGDFHGESIEVNVPALRAGESDE